MAMCFAKCFVRAVMIGALIAGSGFCGIATAETTAVGKVTGYDIPRFVSMRADMANARRGPGRNYQIDWQFVRRGLPVQITAEYGNWRRIRDAEGLGGWVHHTLLTGTRTGLVTGEDLVVIFAGSDESTAVRAKVEPDVVVRIEKCAGEWCLISTEEIEGWLKRVHIWGVSKDETIE